MYLLFKPHKKVAELNQPEAEEGQLAEAEVEQAENIIDQEAINPDTLSKADQFIHSLNKVFRDYNLNEAWISRKEKSISVQLPEEVPAEVIIFDIISEAKRLKLKCKNSRENLKTSQSTLMIVNNRETLFTIFLNNNKKIQRKAGKIAIIVDDFGYFENGTIERFLQLKYPLTVSILPGQKYTKIIAQKAKEAGKPIMLHLPMEPKEGKVEKNEFTLLTTMSEEQIVECLNKALEILPDAVAVNNHMGSKATEDEDMMSIMFRELKRRNLMFIDSKTSLNSVAPRVAKKYGLKFEQNATFLERGKNEDELHIRSKLKFAATMAEKNGKVVIIGHPYRETIEVLSNELPKLEKQGFIIVPVTELEEPI